MGLPAGQSEERMFCLVGAALPGPIVNIVSAVLAVSIDSIVIRYWVGDDDRFYNATGWYGIH